MWTRTTVVARVFVSCGSNVEGSLRSFHENLLPQTIEDIHSTRIASKWNWLERVQAGWGTSILIISAALALNLYQLGGPSLWFDEILSVNRALQPLPVVWKIIWTTQPNMALYYLLLHIWLACTHILGLAPTEAIVRFPSALCAALSSVVVCQIGRRFLSPSASLLATGLYIINAQQLTYAQEARSYSLQLLLLTLSWYALLHVLTEKHLSWHWLTLYVLTSTLAVYAHIFSLLLLFSQATSLSCLCILQTSWRSTVRRRLLLLLPCGFIILTFLVPLLLACKGNDKTAWIPVPNLHQALYVLTAISGFKRSYELGLLALCLFSLMGTCALSMRSLRRPLLRLLGIKRFIECQGRQRNLLPIIVVLLNWCIVPFILSYAISQGSTRLFLARYLVSIVPPLMMLTGTACALISWHYIRIALIASVLFIASLALPFYYQHVEVENWRTPTFWLQDRYQAGDGMVCYNNAQGCEVGIEYYLRAYPAMITFPADAPGAFPWVDYDTTNMLGKFEEALDTAKLTAYAGQHKRLFFIVARLGDNSQVVRARAATRWLDSQYHYQDQIVTPIMVIRLYKTH